MLRVREAAPRLTAGPSGGAGSNESPHDASAARAFAPKQDRERLPAQNIPAHGSGREPFRS
jgi:hypothetical protein